MKTEQTVDLLHEPVHQKKYCLKSIDTLDSTISLARPTHLVNVLYKTAGNLVTAGINQSDGVVPVKTGFGDQFERNQR